MGNYGILALTMSLWGVLYNQPFAYTILLELHLVIVMQPIHPQIKALLISIALFFPFASGVFAQTSTTSAGIDTKIKAFIPDIHLSINGFVSPYASVVLDSNKVFLASVVADGEGKFSFSSIVIQRGTTEFCLKAVDLRLLGSSTTCFTIAPAQKDIVRENIFLPPTVGLSRAVVSEGEDIDVYGYSMPASDVFIDLGDQGFLKTISDSEGYYKLTIVKAEAGKYTVLAFAYLNGVKSLLPTIVLGFTSLSLVSRVFELFPTIVTVIGFVIVTAIIGFTVYATRVKKKSILGIVRDVSRKIKRLFH